jgi:hypothetical protein
MGQMRNINKIFYGKPERRHHLGKPGVHVRIIFEWIFKN